FSGQLPAPHAASYIVQDARSIFALGSTFTNLEIIANTLRKFASVCENRLRPCSLAVRACDSRSHVSFVSFNDAGCGFGGYVLKDFAVLSDELNSVLFPVGLLGYDLNDNLA